MRRFARVLTRANRCTATRGGAPRPVLSLIVLLFLLLALVLLRLVAALLVPFAALEDLAGRAQFDPPLAVVVADLDPEARLPVLGPEFRLDGRALGQALRDGDGLGQRQRLARLLLALAL